MRVQKQNEHLKYAHFGISPTASLPALQRRVFRVRQLKSFYKSLKTRTLLRRAGRLY